MLGSSHSIFDRPSRSLLNEEVERKKWKIIRDKTQRCTFLAIHLKHAPDHLARMRHKLGRWKLDGSDPMLLATLNVKQKTPEYFSRKCAHNLQQLGKQAGRAGSARSVLWHDVEKIDYSCPLPE